MGIITPDTQLGSQFSGGLKTITEERVRDFSGGFPERPGWPEKNIHTDREAATRCGLPEPAASGNMFEGYLTELLIDLFGERWLSHGKMQLTFIRMVRIGDTLLPKAVVQSRETDDLGTRFVMEIWCENQHGEKVVLGTATGLVD
jgi:acyl dehydratase